MSLNIIWLNKLHKDCASRNSKTLTEEEAIELHTQMEKTKMTKFQQN
jgi:hypothetical protein